MDRAMIQDDPIGVRISNGFETIWRPRQNYRRLHRLLLSHELRALLYTKRGAAPKAVRGQIAFALQTLAKLLPSSIELRAARRTVSYMTQRCARFPAQTDRSTELD
jgi:hypothetical protein